MSLINKIIGKLNLSPTKEKVVRNVVWAVTGKVVALLGGLLVGIFVARYLGPEQYGLMSYVMSYVALFQVLASFGLDNIEIREESKRPEEKDKIIGTAFTLKVCFALITMLLVAVTVWIFEADSFTKWMIILYSLSMLVNSFGVIRNYFTSLVWNEYIVKTEITRTFIGAGIKVGLLLIHAPLVWFIAAILLDTILIAGGYMVSYRKKIGLIHDWTFDKERAIAMLRDAFPLLLSGAAVIVYQRIDQIMIGNMLNKEAVGYYAVAGKFIEILIFIPHIASQTFFPILTRIKQENFTTYQQTAQRFINITLWGCIFIAIVLCMCSNILIKITYGYDYIQVVPILQIMTFKIVGMALSETVGQMIIIENQQKYAFIRNTLGCCLAIGLNYWIIPIHGIIGASIISIVVTLFVGSIANLIIPSYHRYFKIQTKALFTGWKDIFNLRYIKI